MKRSSRRDGVGGGRRRWTPSIDNTPRSASCPSTIPQYAQASLLALLFWGVLALNLLADRFWCRYLCPLGALLGLLAKFQVFRPLVGAAAPLRALRACRLGAIDDAPAGERTLRGRHLRVHHVSGLPGRLPRGGTAGLPPSPPAPGRGATTTPAAASCSPPAPAGVGAVALLGTRRVDGGRTRAHPAARRPDEGQFLPPAGAAASASRSGPTRGLQPPLASTGAGGALDAGAGATAGLRASGLWPAATCARSGAIPGSTWRPKRQVLGTAVIDREPLPPLVAGHGLRGLPGGVPRAEKAIALSGGTMVANGQGGTNRMTRPAAHTDVAAPAGGTCAVPAPARSAAVAAIRVELAASGIAPGAVADG